jgi:hypothetical protein
MQVSARGLSEDRLMADSQRLVAPCRMCVQLRVVNSNVEGWRLETRLCHTFAYSKYWKSTAVSTVLRQITCCDQKIHILIVS